MQPATGNGGPRPAGARLDGLDALRGIAALLVTIMHLLHIAQWQNPFNRAYLAVDLFVMLSGYVIARTDEAKFAAGLKLAPFCWKRLTRMWPTMLVGAVIGIALFWNVLPLMRSLEIFVMAALFIPTSQAGRELFPSNPPQWTILYILLGNLLHFLVLWRLGVTALIVLIVAAVAHLAAFAPNLNVGNLAGEHWLALSRMVAAYVIGIVLWRLAGQRALLPGWLGLVAVPVAILLAGLNPADSRWQDFVIAYALCPVVVLSALSPLPFARRALVFLGAISFPLYAVHFPIAILLRRAGWGPLETLPVVLVAAWLASLLVEKMTRPRRPAPVPA